MAVQMTYLDPVKGIKLKELPIPKRTIGSMQGSFVDLNKAIKDPSRTFIAEGIETALSIKDALSKAQKQSAQVLASLGKSNLAKLPKAVTSKNITLVLDNDKTDWRKDKSISDAIASLENQAKTVNCIQPKSLNSEKTDYNDLARGG